MNRFTTIRHLGLVVLAFILLPLLCAAQTSGADCREELHRALQLRNAPADSGYALYRAMTITTYSSAGDTATTEAVSIEAGGLFVVRTDSGEVWQDSASMVVIDLLHKQMRVIDLEGREGVFAARQQYQKIFFDSLAGDMRNLSCVGGSDTRQISGKIISDMQPFYKAQGISIEIRSDGEIVRFVTEHLPGNLIRKSEYIVTEINRRYGGVHPDQSVREHFFDAEGKLRKEYKEYQITQR